MFKSDNKLSSNKINKTLRIITDKDFDNQAPDFDQSRAWTRQAVRAVLINDQDQICLMHSQRFNYYKLPGGGIKDGETNAMTLARELLEEVGAQAEIIGEIGKIEELRVLSNNMRQLSYAYVARVMGEIGDNHLEEDEKEEQFVPIWVGLDKAIRLMVSGNVESERGLSQRFMALRDETFLSEYKKLKENKEIKS